MLDLQANRRFMVKSGVFAGGGMVHGDTAQVDELTRLETALDKIAQLGARPTPPETAIVAARLDVLISQLRDALTTGNPKA